MLFELLFVRLCENQKSWGAVIFFGSGPKYTGVKFFDDKM